MGGGGGLQLQKRSIKSKTTNISFICVRLYGLLQEEVPLGLQGGEEGEAGEGEQGLGVSGGGGREVEVQGGVGRWRVSPMELLLAIGTIGSPGGDGSA